MISKETIEFLFYQSFANMIQNHGYFVCKKIQLNKEPILTDLDFLHKEGIYSNVDLLGIFEIVEPFLIRQIESCYWTREQAERVCEALELDPYGYLNLSRIHPNPNLLPLTDEYEQEDILVERYKNYLYSDEAGVRWALAAKQLKRPIVKAAVYEVTWEITKTGGTPYEEWQDEIWQKVFEIEEEKERKFIGYVNLFPYNWLKKAYGKNLRMIPYYVGDWKSELEQLPLSTKWAVILHYGYLVSIEDILRIAETPVNKITIKIMKKLLVNSAGKKIGIGYNMHEYIRKKWQNEIAFGATKQTVMRKMPKCYWEYMIYIRDKSLCKTEGWCKNHNITYLTADDSTKRFIEKHFRNNMKFNYRHVEGNLKECDVLISGINYQILNWIFVNGIRTISDLINKCFVGEIDNPAVIEYAKDLAKNQLTVRMVDLNETKFKNEIK